MHKGADSSRKFFYKLYLYHISSLSQKIIAQMVFCSNHPGDILIIILFIYYSIYSDAALLVLYCPVYH